MSHVQCAIKSHNLSLKVDFLFQSFLVITVRESSGGWYRQGSGALLGTKLVISYLGILVVQSIYMRSCLVLQGRRNLMKPYSITRYKPGVDIISPNLLENNFFPQILFKYFFFSEFCITNEFSSKKYEKG